MGRKTKRQRERKQAQRRAGNNSDQVLLDEGQATVDVNVGYRRPRVQPAGMGAPPNRRGPYPRRSDATRDHPIVEAFRQIGENLAAARDRQGNLPPRKASHVRPSPLQQDQARRRLEALNTFLQAKPVPILDQLKGLGVPFNVAHNVPGDRKYDTVVIKLVDLEEADRKIASKGTLYEQLYKGDVP